MDELMKYISNKKLKLALQQNNKVAALQIAGKLYDKVCPFSKERFLLSQVFNVVRDEKHFDEFGQLKNFELKERARLAYDEAMKKPLQLFENPNPAFTFISASMKKRHCAEDAFNEVINPNY